jgi:SAM-dependent methyltransferase
MPSIQENQEKWNQYRWPQAGDEWSTPWGDSNQVWWAVLFPRIGKFLPTSSMLEIAPGFGRWTRYLQQFTEQYIGIDVAEAAVEACRKEFPKLQFQVNDGKSLPMVADRSISFCFSYDSLVHVDRDTMRAYVGELGRILTDTGVAFLHHSNLGAYEKILPTKQFLAKVVPSWRVRKRLKLIPETHWRDPAMTAELMRSYCDAQGLYCRQEPITWLETDDLMTDCFTLVSRAPMTYKREENRDFGKFSAQMKLCSDLYWP